MTIEANNSFLNTALGNWLSPAEQQTLLTFINSSATMTAMVSQAESAGYKLVLDAAQGAGAECDTARQRIKVGPALLSGSTYRPGDFLMVLAHELGHAFARDGHGSNVYAGASYLPSEAKATANAFAYYSAYLQEGGANYRAYQVRNEVLSSYPSLQASLIVPGLAAVMQQVDANAAANPANAHNYIREVTANAVLDVVPPSMVGQPQPPTYRMSAIKHFILSSLGAACDISVYARMILTQPLADYDNRSTWGFAIKGIRGDTWYYNEAAANSQKLQRRNAVGKLLESYQGFSSNACSALPSKMPSNVLGYFSQDADGDSLWYGDDGSPVEYAGDDAEFSAMPWEGIQELAAGPATEVYLYADDTSRSFAAAESARVILDSSLEGVPVTLLRSGTQLIVQVGSDLLAEGSISSPLVVTSAGAEFDVDALLAAFGGDGVVLANGVAQAITSEQGESKLVLGDGGTNVIRLGSQFLGVVAGKGNDHVEGNAGADRYWYARGDGRDTLDTHGGGDELDLGDIRVDEAAFTRTGNDLVMELPSGGAITVTGWFDAGNGRQLGTAKFADQTLTAEEITARVGVILTEGNDTYTGTSGADVVYGLGGSDNINGGSGTGGDKLYGGGGNDLLYGMGGDDLLEGGDGDDVLDGGAGGDTLRGGAGNDTLGGGSGSQDAGYDYFGSYVDPGAGNEYEGGRGDDTLNGTTRVDLYLFSQGDGRDIIKELNMAYGPSVGAEDILRFGPGISPADVSVRRSGTDLILALSGGADQLTIKDWYSASGQSITAKQLELVQFVDYPDAVWTASALTSQGLEVHGTSASESLQGLSYYANVLFGHEGVDTLTGGALADQLFGGDGNDILVGGDGADVLGGGAGNDWLEGGTGSDVYRYFAGEGKDTIYDTSGSADTLDFGAIPLSAAVFYRSGNNLEVSLGTGQGVVVSSQFNPSFAMEFFLFGGQSYSASQINALAGPKP
jgi:Ca2+-binding RTX toxin-like protein